MKNVLNNKQEYQLAQWLESNKDGGLTRTSACGLASHELLFQVTYSNMQSAERATGISLVKPPKAKAAVHDDLEARIAKLESELESFRQYCRVPIPESLLASYIKPGPVKPFICHKHG